MKEGRYSKLKLNDEKLKNYSYVFCHKDSERKGYM